MDGSSIGLVCRRARATAIFYQNILFYNKQIRNKEMGFGRGYVHGGEGSLPAIIRTIDP